MPGTIRVSVLEAIDLPETFSDGTYGKNVTTKVTFGTRQFKTESRVADDGRVDSWNSSFALNFFYRYLRCECMSGSLVTNLRDKLVVAICDNEDRCLTQTSIEVPSIIEKGSRDEFVELIGGGRIHLSMSFVLTDEERKKIEKMRLAVLKRREEERAKGTIVFRNVQLREYEFEPAPASAVTISEVEDSSSDEYKDLQREANGPLGFGSTARPSTSILMFDYARAVGLRTEKKTKFWAAENVSNKVKASIDNTKSEEQTGRLCAENEVEVGCAEITTTDSSLLSFTSSQCAALSLTSLTNSATSPFVLPSMQDASTGKASSGAVKMQVDVLESTFQKERDEFVMLENVNEENEFHTEGQKVRSVLDSESAVAANMFCKQSILFGGMKKSDFKGDATQTLLSNTMRKCDGQQAVWVDHISRKIINLEVASGRGRRPEARSGPGARWAQKAGLETRWASPEKARRFVRVDRNGQVLAPLRARAMILKLMNAAGGSHEAYGDDRTLEESQSVADSIGAILNKVVGGAAILLATLFMMLPFSEDSCHRSDGSSGDDILHDHSSL